jgi:hypothetical protein
MFRPVQKSPESPSFPIETSRSATVNTFGTGKMENSDAIPSQVANIAAKGNHGK